MEDGFYNLVFDVSQYLERIAEALESIEDNMRVQHETEGADL